jgi:Asp-tRNA(Asn)/Glu-tRNA(Gln) amidotransferase B subunit
MHAHVQDNRCSFDDLALAPAALAELLAAVEEGLISGKIVKQVLPELLQVLTQSCVSSLLVACADRRLCMTATDACQISRSHFELN